jgi:hypothetical protein
VARFSSQSISLNASDTATHERGAVNNGDINNISTNISIFLAAVFIFAIIFYNGQNLKFLGGKWFSLTTYTIYAFTFVSIIVAILLIQLKEIVISFFIFFYIFSVVYFGGKISPTGPTFPILMQFSPLFISPIISLLFKRRVFYVLEVMIAVAVTCYCISYDYLSLTVHASSELSKTGNGFLAGSNDARGSRIALDGSAALICIFLGLSWMKSKTKPLLGLVMASTAALAFYLSKSRAIEAHCAIFVIVFIVIGYNKYIAKAVSAFVFLSNLIFIMLFLQGYNIYSQLGGGDQSIQTRATELENARDPIMNSLGFGVGFVNPIKVGANASIDFDKDVVWNDLGIYGILYSSGFFGVFIYVAMNLMLISSAGRFQRLGLSKATSDGFVCAGMCIAAMSVSIPTVWASGMELFCIVLAAYIASSFQPMSRSVLLASSETPA